MIQFFQSKILFLNNIVGFVFRMDDIRRIDAAKQLFNSFASRIQAYKLHHALGLTLFSTKITIKLAVTKNIEEFEVR